METKDETKLHSLLYGSGKTLATAESCTGGAIAARIVAQSGASDYFKGGVVSYCNEVKERLLGVSALTLAEQTAVCEDVARQMATGARKALATDYAVAVTGCAGPGGGTEAIPVGTIWLAATSEKLCITKKLSTDRGRELNLVNAVDEAIALVTLLVLGYPDSNQERQDQNLQCYHYTIAQ